MTDLPVFRRDVLFKAFNGDPVLVAAFEQMVRYVAEVAENAASGATVADVLGSASLLALGPVEGLDAALTLTEGEGVAFTNAGRRLTISLNDLTPKIDGGFPVTFIVTGETDLVLPLIGTLATLADVSGAVAGSVTSFNTRTGAITLISGDVTGALGFTPVTNARTISTTGPLSGGGPLSADLTLAISPASGVAAGSMSAADFSKLAAIAAGATANSSDAFLLARANHTGAQLSATISDFTEAAQDAIGAMVDSSLVYVDATPLLTRAALTGDVTAAQGSNATTVVNINGVSLAGLATGILKNTTGTGAPSIAVAGDFPTLNQNTTGNAATATKLATGRTLGITGDLTWTSPSFDGSGNVTAAGTLATVNANVGTFGGATKSLTATVNGKGLVTAISEQTVTPAVGSITGLGTGVATALAVNVGSGGAFVTFNGAGGTPSSLTLTNATGLPVAGGGTGRATSTTPYGLLAAGTTATGAHQTLAAGATTDILVGGGASALPAWTTATGTGAPVRAGSPTLTGTTAVAALTASGLILSTAAAGDANFQANQTTGSVAVNGTYDFTAQSYGLFFIAETNATGQMALCCTDGATVRIIYQSGAAYTTTLNNAGTVNLYYNGGTPRVQNKLASSANFRIVDLRLN